MTASRVRECGVWVVVCQMPRRGFLCWSVSRLGGIKVRVVNTEITISTATGCRTGIYCLATTLLDHRRHPASDLVTLYHQRWEIETAYLELKSTILGRTSPARPHPDGVHQEVYALLVAYQLLCTAMADAAGSRADIDPDRASFVVDLIGTIGRHILADLMPDRQRRCRPVDQALHLGYGSFPIAFGKPDHAPHCVKVSSTVCCPPRGTTVCDASWWDRQAVQLTAATTIINTVTGTMNMAQRSSLAIRSIRARHVAVTAKSKRRPVAWPARVTQRMMRREIGHASPA